MHIGKKNNHKQTKKQQTKRNKKQQGKREKQKIIFLCCPVKLLQQNHVHLWFIGGKICIKVLGDVKQGRSK